MNDATKQRDVVARQAKTDSRAALKDARNIADPWFRAQALAHVVRYCDGCAISIADQAADAAEHCLDAYKQCAVRAWEIAALAERSDNNAALARLKSVLSKIEDVNPLHHDPKLCHSCFTRQLGSARMLLRPLPKWSLAPATMTPIGVATAQLLTLLAFYTV